MRIAICGSLTHTQEMVDAKNTLVGMGFEVELPYSIEESLVRKASTEKRSPEKKNWYILDHFKKIKNSDAVLIINFNKNGVENYIGGNTLMEIGIAMEHNLKVFLLNPAPDLSYLEEINGALPIVINNDLNKIQEFKNNLQNIYLASESNIKIRAVSNAVKRFSGIKNILGISTDSQIPNQPVGLDQTILGAKNRLMNLKLKTTQDYEYLVSIESGLISDEAKENYFDIGVCIVEDKYGAQEIGLSCGTNISQSMVKEVFETGIELGILLKKNYGIKEKDPVIVYTKNKITRAELLEDVVYNTLCRF